MNQDDLDSALHQQQLCERQEQELNEAIHSLEWYKRAKKLDRDLKQLREDTKVRREPI